MKSVEKINVVMLTVLLVAVLGGCGSNESTESTVTTEQNTSSDAVNDSTDADTSNQTDDTHATIGSDNNGTNEGDDNSISGGNDNNTATGGEDNSTGSDSNTTITLKALMLTVQETSLNKDANTTIKVEATYSDNTSKDVTQEVEWIADKQDAVAIQKHTLQVKKDTNLTLRAKLNGKTSNPVTLNIYWEVNGHRLPPEPDPAVNNSTLLGIDVNSNGVRDDVERWIYEEYKDKHPIHIDIAMQAAKGYRLVLEKQPKTKVDAKEIHQEVRKPLQCESYFRVCIQKPLIEAPIVVNNRFKSLLFNTKKRKDTYIRYDILLSGDSYTVPWCSDRKQKCDFNTTKYE